MNDPRANKVTNEQNVDGLDARRWLGGRARRKAVYLSVRQIWPTFCDRCAQRARVAQRLRAVPMNAPVNLICYQKQSCLRTYYLGYRHICLFMHGSGMPKTLRRMNAAADGLTAAADAGGAS
jgi:hypothetical protein